LPRTLQVVASKSPGDFITGALWNTVKAATDFLSAVPVFMGYASTSQAITSGAYTSFTLDTEVFDSDGGHSTITNTSRYVPQVPGLYIAVGSSGWAANATGYRRTRLALSGTAVKGSATSSGQTENVTAGGQAIGLVSCNGTTDYIEVQGAQDTGGNLGTISTVDFACSLTVFFLSS
jgi:hypothetical protein